MVFRVVYFRDGRQIGDTPHDGPLPLTERFAREGLIRHGADFYRIIDLDGSHTEVASGRQDAKVS
jgi:hypothetical protein